VNAHSNHFSRRELMRVGGLSLFGGMTLTRLLAADRNRPRGPVRSVVLFNLLGGPSHQDMFDMKPGAPANIRGEFKPAATSAPGTQICEHLPQTAKIMHKTCLIRSVTHNYNAHNPLNIMTGFSGGDPKQLRPKRTDPPDIGAICQYLELGPRDLPGAFCLPCYPGWGERSQYPGIRRPGPYGGFLGSQYDPVISVCEPTFERVPERKYYDPVWPYGEPQLPLDQPREDLPIARMNSRRQLLQQLDQRFGELESSGAVGRMDRVKRQAFDMISSSRTRSAFDLSVESDQTRERYGRNLHGSSMLVARRLVEAGAPFISVHAENFIPHGFTYDMHENNFGMLKDYNLPVLDMCFPALVEDLEDRGLLESTLVVVMGEMGRSPKVNTKAGRDHWPQCGFCLLAGGGVAAGGVYGASDRHAAYPVDNPVSPADIVATIYHQLGVDPHVTVNDPSGRPVPIAHGGRVLKDVLS
jgi:hypothetical protein